MLDDRYPFDGDRAAVELGRFYDAYRRQLVMSSSSLPRMRFEFGSGTVRRTVDADSFAFLRTLIQFETDPGRDFVRGYGIQVTRG